MKTMCKIPVTARFEIVNGEAVMTAAEYEDIPADLIAQYILAHWHGPQSRETPDANEKPLCAR